MQAREILKKYFGYDDFREGQKVVIDSIMSNRDAFAIMPTGAGKSICYQVPALMLGGISIVVSPLISLMHDQVVTLKSVGIAGAYINSTLSPKQVETALYNASKGMYKIIYVAPERLLTQSFLDFAVSTDISMIAIDEAHCISQWGQDFRPSYLEIPKLISKLKKRPVISAFTATATEKVKVDILNALSLKDPKLVTGGFDRKNLFFEVSHPVNKTEELMKFINSAEKYNGIIYCTSRKKVEELSSFLLYEGFKATRYHAGLTAEERSHNQNDFLYGRSKIMVATNAFGMGIDKSNINYVIHYNLPKDVESYYQEAGRAGRDGSPARCILFYSPKDVLTIKWMIENSEDDKAELSEKEHALLKAREYERLQDMILYATQDGCLRNYILNYFGEKRNEDCHNCSNCNNDNAKVDITEVLCQILTCVTELKGGFGQSTVIDILRGSKNAKVQNYGFDRLESYNTIKKSTKELKFILNNLVFQGYLNQDEGQYPLLKLGEREFLGEVVEIKMPKDFRSAKEKTAKTTKSKGKHAEGGLELFELLREIRTELALTERVPSYVVFPDKTLHHMCEIMPKTLEEMLTVSGVGEVKLKKYGQKFLDIIENFDK